MGPRAPEKLTLLVDVTDLVADVGTVDALARLALIARRHDCEIRLCHASQYLRELIDLAGLTEVLPSGPLTPRSKAPRC